MTRKKRTWAWGESQRLEGHTQQKIALFLGLSIPYSLIDLFIHSLTLIHPFTH